MGGSPFIIMSRVNMIGFVSRRPIGWRVGMTSEKVTNCYGASTRRFDKE